MKVKSKNYFHFTDFFAKIYSLLTQVSVRLLEYSFSSVEAYQNSDFLFVLFILELQLEKWPLVDILCI